MTEETEELTLTFNGVEHDVNSLTDYGKYVVSQLKDLQTQESQLKAKLDQVSVATKGFSELLGKELEPKETTEEVSEE